jgi:hypothetical protein
MEGETYGGGVAEPPMMLMRVEDSMFDDVEVRSEVTGRSRRPCGQCLFVHSHWLDHVNC